MKKLKQIAIITVSAFAFYFGANKLGKIVHAAGPITVKPLSAQQAYYSIREGTRVFSEDATTLRRSDGTESFQRLVRSAPGETKLSKFITYPDGTNVTVSDELRLKSTTHLSENALSKRFAHLMAPPTDCVFGNETVSEHKFVGGQQAVVLVSVHTNDPFTRDVSMRLPAFSCFELEHTLEQRLTSSSPWQIKLGMTTTSFTQEEPAQNEFTGYEQYAEASPGALYHAWGVKRGFTATQCPKCYVPDPKAEAAYVKAHEGVN